MLRGGVLKGYFDFVLSEHGKDAWQDCILNTNINPKDLKDKDLYPEAYNIDLLTCISDQYGLEELRKVGNYTAKNLGGLAHLVRFANIKFFLRKAKESYEETFPFGKVSVLTDEFSKNASVIFKDSNVIEESCVAWLGAFEGFLEVTRTKGTVEKVKCQVKGDEYCEYKLRWE